MQTEMVQQINLTYEAIRKLGLSVLMLDGFEADDIIGTLARRAEDEGHKRVDYFIGQRFSATRERQCGASRLDV